MRLRAIPVDRWRVEPIAPPDSDRLERLLAAEGAGSLAGCWFGREGTFHFPWPEGILRIPAGGRGAIDLLDRIDREAELSGRGEVGEDGPDGWLLALSYDAGRRMERFRTRLPARPEVPDLVLVRHRGGIFVPAAGGGGLLVSPPELLGDRLRELERGGAKGGGIAARAGFRPLEAIAGLPRAVTSDFSREAFEDAVGAIRRGIGRGDYYQVNLTRRFRIRPPRGVSGFALFRRLRERHEAPRGFFLRAGGGLEIVSNSPELFLVADFRGRRVLSSPIKGTAERSRDAAEDRRSARRLRGSEKDRAEHVMIVDLVRNDLGRVAEAGSVQVEGFCRPLSTPVVHHLVSDVVAGLRPGVGPGGLVAASFPPGSVTGAPKIAALAAIERLETVRRGFYCGALGFYDRRGRRLELSVAIRTGVLVGDALDFHAGGGIVADSEAGAEWNEGNWKAREFFELASGRDRNGC
jgi:para-aminobenzoate synthetase component 1